MMGLGGGLGVVLLLFPYEMFRPPVMGTLLLFGLGLEVLEEEISMGEVDDALDDG